MSADLATHEKEFLMDGGATGASGVASSSAMRRDLTWKSTLGVSFGETKMRAWTPDNGIHFSPQLPPQLRRREGGRYCSTPVHTMSSWSPDQGADSTSSQPEHHLRRDPIPATLYPSDAPCVQSVSQSEANLLPEPTSELEPIVNFEPECSAESERFSSALDVLRITCAHKDSVTSEGDRSPLGNSLETSPSREGSPFRTPLGFHIPEARLQQAIDAAPTNVGAYWQYTLYQGPGGDKDKVKVHYCKSREATERICQLFLNEETIGFDIEWKMNALATEGVKKNVALIQIASEERIALFHIARYPNAITVDDFVAPSFKTIMESSSITKVGVSVKGDCNRLRKFMAIESRGIFELSHLYKLVKFSSGDVKKINKVMVSLAQQVQEHLRLPLWKGEVRSSDWSQDLNYQQIQYAASDSYAGFQLYHILEAKRKALEPTPPRPAHAELNLPISLANGQTVATYNETPENIEETTADTGPDLPISIEELTRDFLSIEIEESSPKNPIERTGAKSATRSLGKAVSPSKQSQAASSLSSASTSSSYPSSAFQISKKPLHCDVVEAEAWVVGYMRQPRADRKVIAKPADLRAYHLWHHQDLEIAQVANRLRDPPLAISTVASYILRAIHFEHLPFRRKRVWILVPHIHRSCRGPYEAMIVQRLEKEEKQKEKEGSAKDQQCGNEDFGNSEGDEEDISRSTSLS